MIEFFHFLHLKNSQETLQSWAPIETEKKEIIFLHFLYFNNACVLEEIALNTSYFILLWAALSPKAKNPFQILNFEDVAHFITLLSRIVTHVKGCQ